MYKIKKQNGLKVSNEGSRDDFLITIVARPGTDRVELIEVQQFLCDFSLNARKIVVMEVNVANGQNELVHTATTARSLFRAVFLASPSKQLSENTH